MFILKQLNIMITLQQLKDKIEKIEHEIKENDFSLDNIYLQPDYLNSVDDIELDFICNEDYGVYVQISVV
jgi:hypothetical protein